MDHGSVDTQTLSSALAGLTEEDWQRDSEFFSKITKNRPGSSLVLTSNVDFSQRIRWRKDFEAGVCYSYKMCGYALIGTETETWLRDVVLPLYPGTDIARMQYTRLQPGEAIPHHADRGMLVHMHRLHIPLMTNPRVRFNIGGRGHFLKEGHLYELNNQIPHSVKNNGSTARIHLIADLLPQAIACIERLERYEDLPPPVN